MEEALEFCTKYMQRFQSMEQWVWDDCDDQNMYNEVLQGYRHMRTMIADLGDYTHSFIIKNAITLEPWWIWVGKHCIM
jgi:hypothetical protein